jgi:ribose transport system substrate-binding protein
MGWLLAVVVVVLGLGFVGCGSSDDSDSSSAQTDTAAASSGGTDDVVAKAKAQVEQLMQTEGVKLPAPTEPFDPGKKRVAVVLAGQDAGFDAMNDGVQAAAKTMGWTVGPAMDGKFSPTDQAGFIQQAVQEKYDAIILLVIDAATVESALTAANKAKIPVACVMCDNEGYEGKIYDVTTGGYPAGQAMAQYVIADSGGKAKILAFNDKGFAINPRRVAGFEDTIAKDCPDCEIVADLQTSAAELSKPGPPSWLGALRRYPEGTFDYGVWPGDYWAVPAGKTTEEQGREVGLTGYDGTPEMVGLIKKGGPIFKATISAPFPYLGWAAMDVVARASAGLKVWDTTKMPVRLVTVDNAADFPEGWFVPKDVDPKETFGKLWKGN